ncbi:hypothetical protein BMG03_19205 (plasmid) [Thioclava nitratireducens]|uniref:Uncharacterized protein n=1 Tax=Thioclava nitratireducens TaxID=1915078 RepID=A0ABM6IMJ8_9RHOB|nr:hypothetical protein [Thioclava nitratireducens]AQS50054.1 hypothetical protein BMG03_19205 [Thioclava nitratireducens]
MGLTVHAFSNLRRIDASRDMKKRASAPRIPNRAFAPVIDPDFAHYAPELEPGKPYDYDEHHRFEAGSYDYIKTFKSELCALAIARNAPDYGAESDQDSDKLDAYFHHSFHSPHAPFSQLIHFSESEGTLSTSVVKKLERDFKEHAQLAHEHPCMVFIYHFLKWQVALEVGADLGCISFQ